MASDGIAADGIAADDFVDLVETFRVHAAREPGAPALAWFDDRARITEQHDRKSYLNRTEGLAGALRARGVEPGEPVLLIHPPGLAFFEAFFACLIAGAVPVPAYPPDPLARGPRLDFITRATAKIGIRVALSTSRYVNARRLGDLRHVLRRGDGWPALRWLATDRLAAGPTPPPHRPAPDDIAFMQFTSGSTSTPRGVAISHRNLMHQLRANAERSGMGPESRAVAWLPQYHDFGLVNAFLCSLWVGCPAWLCSPLDFLKKPSIWPEMMHRVRATHSGSPDFGYAYTIRKTTQAERRRWDLSALRCTASGGEAIRPATVRAFAEAFAESGFDRGALYGGYGLAEHTIGISGGPVALMHFDAAALAGGVLEAVAAEHPRAHELASSGWPFADVALCIVEPETGAVLPAGQIGEIWARSDSVALGYVGEPEASAATFDNRLAGEGERRWLRTGDLGALVEGHLFVTGRLKELIIVRGRNVHPADVEDAVRETAHPALRPGGVAAVGCEFDGEEQLAVLVELRDGRAVPEDLAEVVRAAVAEGGLHLARLVVVAKGALPKTTSGKLQRRLTAERLAAGGFDALLDRRWIAPPPDTTADDALVEALAKLSALPAAERRPAARAALLGWIAQHGAEVARAEADDAGLHALGLDSLAIAELVERVERGTGRSLARAELHTVTTLAALVDWILAPPASPVAAPVAALTTTDGPVPATSFQRHIHHDHGTAPAAALLVEVEGPLTATAVQAALEALVARHDLLRAGFELRDSALTLVPHSSATAALTVLAPGSGDAPITTIEAALRAPFDLARPPLLRAVFAPGEPGRAWVGVALHHLIYDGYSIHALLAEWLDALATAAAGEALAHTPSPSFLAVARQQPAPTEAARAWWRRALAEVRWPMPVPHDVPVAAPALVPAGRFVLEPATVAALTTLARRCDTTLDAVVAAAWAEALGQALDWPVITCAHPVSLRDGRTRAVCGPLVEDVLLALPADPEITPADRVRRAGAALAGAIRHADLPLDDQLAGLPGQPARCPLLYAFQDWDRMAPDAAVRALRRREPCTVGPLTLRPLPLAPPGGPRPFDAFALAEVEDGHLACSLRVEQTRIGAPLGAAIVARWQTALTALAAAEPTR